LCRLSHRGAEFTEIIESAQKNLRKILCDEPSSPIESSPPECLLLRRNVPANYDILFMHGGGNGQFAAVPLNLLPGADEKAFGDYLISGIASFSLDLILIALFTVLLSFFPSC